MGTVSFSQVIIIIFLLLLMFGDLTKIVKRFKFKTKNRKKGS